MLTAPVVDNIQPTYVLWTALPAYDQRRLNSKNRHDMGKYAIYFSGAGFLHRCRQISSIEAKGKMTHILRLPFAASVTLTKLI